jgi:hypothetical protein
MEVFLTPGGMIGVQVTAENNGNGNDNNKGGFGGVPGEGPDAESLDANKAFLDELLEFPTVPPSDDEHPEARQWLWVVTYPVTNVRDNMLVLEGDKGDYVPVFVNRDEAEAFLDKIGGREQYLVSQAMHVFDARKFGREKSMDLVTLAGSGQILGRWSHLTPPDESEKAGGTERTEKPAG